MKIPVEEIVKRCEGLYQLSLKSAIKNAHILYGEQVMTFLDICLLFEDIPPDIFTEINSYYIDRFNGIKQDTYLLGYDLSKIKLIII